MFCFVLFSKDSIASYSKPGDALIALYSKPGDASIASLSNGSDAISASSLEKKSDAKKSVKVGDDDSDIFNIFKDSNINTVNITVKKYCNK